MKSAHRHQLESNALAQRLDVAIERFKPYASTAMGVIVAACVLMLIWSYVSRSSATRQGEAWDVYNKSLGSWPPDLEELHRSAQEYPGTKMQRLADITWADGQVFMASENYIYNRPAANQALDRATNVYRSIVQNVDDERVLNRARLGLARVYEMKNELDKAREEYLKIGGGYAEFAKLQAERLADPDTKEAYAWLAKAEPPRRRAPAGPGTPGQRPDFSAGDFPLPGEAPEDGAPGTTPGQSESFEDLLKGLGLDEPTADVAEPDDASDKDDASEKTSPETDSAAPAVDQPPPDDTPAAEKPAE